MLTLLCIPVRTSLRRSTLPDHVRADVGNAAFDAFVHKWFEVQPQQAALDVFYAPRDRTLARAWGTLVHELEQSASDARDATIVAAKLAWWREEIATAAAGDAHHPITVQLFGQARARNIDSHDWLALAGGALALREVRSAASLRETVAQLNGFYLPVARIETSLFQASQSQLEGAAMLWAISRLLARARHAAVLAAAPDLPLELLARHGLTRSALASDSRERNAAVGDYLKFLSDEIQRGLDLSPHAAVACRVTARVNLTRLKASLRVRNPMLSLAQGQPVGLRTLWIAWSESRRERRRE